MRPPLRRDEIGRLGNYRVLRLLGAGGMGIVFHAEDLALRRPVALKVMRPELDDGSGHMIKRFLREARAMAASKHDHLVTVYQVGQAGDLPYLAMELLEGETLESWLGHGGRPDPRTIVRLGRQITVGLAAIHGRGLIHRDIKPANLWLDAASGRVKILDFGLVRDLGRDQRLTAPGIIVGTPAYLAPEQASGTRSDARADLFSLGCVLYRLCTGRVPFPGKNALDQLAALAAEQPVPIDALNPAIPRPLADLVMWLLAKNPGDRPQSVTIVAERLHQIQATLGKIKASPDPAERLAGRPTTKTRFRPVWRFVKCLWPRVIRITAAVVLAVLAMVGMAHLMGAFASAPSGSDVASDARTYLSQMRKVHTKNWPFHGPPGGKGPKGPPIEIFEPISVQGRPSPHGVFMHPAPPFAEPASITYHLNKHYRTFAAQVSLNDSAPRAPSPLTFAVYGDGKVLWRSQGIVSQAQTEQCAIAVNHVNLLKLEVTAGGDIRRAHAVWIEPYVHK